MAAHALKVVSQDFLELHRLLESADGKGVPIRHAADAPPIRDHQHRPGPKPDRKRMATVGAVYSVDRFVRTPEQVLEALFHDPAEPPSPDAPERPRPQYKWTYARLDDDPDQPEAMKGQAATFGWLDEQVRARLERTGMSWTRPGAQAMLNLRAIWTCDQWDEFDKYRIERETARLYPYRESLSTLEWPLAL